MPKKKVVRSRVDEYARQVALEAVREYRKEEKDRCRQRRFHNIGLLMDNYLDLLEHCEKIKYKTDDIVDYFGNMDLDIVRMDEVSIEAIKRSKARTLIIVSQIQTAMELLKADMEACGEYEKYIVVKMLYMDPENKRLKFSPRVKLIAEQVKCDGSTVRRWNSEMLNKLAVKIFGADGLRLDI